MIVNRKKSDWSILCLSTVLRIVLEREELFQIVCHKIACIVAPKGNAIENEHYSVPFPDCIGKFDGILFRIHCFILSNLIEALQLEYNQAIVQHGNCNEYHTNKYVGS